MVCLLLLGGVSYRQCREAMERIKIQALPRAKDSKGSKKTLRKKGYVPAVVYGRGSEPELVSLDGQFLRKVLGSSAGSNVLMDLEIEGVSESSGGAVMIKELQRHPIQKDMFIHADLIRISLDEKLEVEIPLNLVGEPEGVQDGGILQIQLREIRVRCLPGNIPQSIDFSVEEMKVGDVIAVADLTLPEGVELVEEPDEIVASVTIPQVVEEPEEVEEEAIVAETEGEAEAETGETEEADQE